MQVQRRTNTFMSAVLGVALITLSANGQAETEEAAFISAQPIAQAAPEYPKNQKMLANGGLVDLTFMVDKEGKVFEPIVRQSSRKAFESHAIKAVMAYQYSPATVHGKPIDSVQSIRMVFEISDSKEADADRFSRLFRSVVKRLDKKKTDVADVAGKIAMLERFEVLSPYQYAHLKFAKYRFANRFGTKEEQIAAIENMLLYEGRSGGDGDYLDKKTRTAARQNLLILYVETQRYSNALMAYEELLKIDSKAEKLFGTSIKQIKQVRHSEHPVVVNLEIEDRGYASIDLFKKIFAFSNVEGNLDGVKLRCNKKYSELRFSTETEYQIPKGWGNCNLQMIGQPDTKFRLVQY